MAVTAAKLSSAMVIKVVTGKDAKNNDLLKSITLKNLKPEAVEQDIHDVAQAVAGLMNYPVSGYFRQSLDELVNA